MSIKNSFEYKRKIVTVKFSLAKCLCGGDAVLTTEHQTGSQCQPKTHKENKIKEKGRHTLTSVECTSGSRFQSN